MSTLKRKRGKPPQTNPLELKRKHDLVSAGTLEDTESPKKMKSLNGNKLNPATMKVTELRKALRERGIDASGLKVDLEERLVNALTKEISSEESATARDPLVWEGKVFAMLDRLHLQTLAGDQHTVTILANHDFNTLESLEGISCDELRKCGLSFGMANTLTQAVTKAYSSLTKRPSIRLISTNGSGSGADGGASDAGGCGRSSSSSCSGIGSNGSSSSSFRTTQGSSSSSSALWPPSSAVPPASASAASASPAAFTPRRNSFGAVDMFEWAVDDAARSR
jgi:hypothetical protein